MYKNVSKNYAKYNNFLCELAPLISETRYFSLQNIFNFQSK